MKYALDRDDKAMEFMEQEWAYQIDLRNLLKEVDNDNNGRISQEEFEEAVGTGKMTNFLDMLGFKRENLLEHYKVVAGQSPDGLVDIDEFTHGCMQLKGNASSFDLKALVSEQQQTRQELSTFMTEMRAKNTAHGQDVEPEPRWHSK